MVGWSTLIAVVGGLPLGILLVLTDQGGLLQNVLANKVIGADREHRPVMCCAAAGFRGSGGSASNGYAPPSKLHRLDGVRSRL